LKKRKKYKPNEDWRLIVDHVRSEAMKTINKIRSGSVDLDELDKLQNHLMFSLALMQMEGPQKWELAKLNAKIMSFNIAETKNKDMEEE
jgi:hypothetical protein